MTSDRPRQPPGFYTNPVYPHSFPDPYILKFNGEYFAYCTGDSPDGNIFGVLRSRDLIAWDKVGGAMRRLADDSPYYWAPEVTYWNGTFFLYYSVGNEELMQIRLATSKNPDHGFEDTGIRLTDEDFAIDPHVFTDRRGTRYLFYATDFLDHTHIGTGIVVDRMTSWYELEGKPTPVVRAKYDWQVYDPQRKEKGGVRWHTVEGPFVLERKGRKYLMFSGGNWKQPSYGVGFAATDDIERSEEWQQFCDGIAIAPVLRSEERKLVGPGHNSVVRGTDNRQLYCVYHYWQAEERVLAVNRMSVVGDHILVEQDPYLPKRWPILPLKRFSLSAEHWRPVGDWNFTDETAVNHDFGYAEISSESLPESFLCEFSIKSGLSEGQIGFTLRGETALASLQIVSDGVSAKVRWQSGGDEVIEEPLAAEFDLEAIHLVRLEVNFRRVEAEIADANLRFYGSLPDKPEHLVLDKFGVNANFSGLHVTDGFEDLFDGASDDILINGWNVDGARTEWRVVSNQLFFRSDGENESVLRKGAPACTNESLINLRLADAFTTVSSFGFVVIDERGNYLQRLLFSNGDPNVILSDGPASDVIPLPVGIGIREFHQYSFHKYGSSIEFEIDTKIIHSWELDVGRVSIGILAKECEIAIDMVRVTNSAYSESNGS